MFELISYFKSISILARPASSLKAVSERSLNDQGLSTLPATLENATILTDISHSTATLVTTVFDDTCSISSSNAVFYSSTLVSLEEILC